MSKLKWLQPPRWLVFVVIFILFTLVAWRHLDPDFGWHLVSGQYFLAHGVPKTDIFSYTATHFSWVNHEWLSDIILSIIYSLGGYGLAAVVYGVMWTLSFYLIGRRANGWVLLAAIAAVLPCAGVRGVTWSVLGLAALLTLLNIWRQKLSSRRRLLLGIAIVALIGLWANLHGGFIVGIAVVVFYAFLQKSWRLGLVAIGGALLALINPYGIGIYVEVTRTLLDTSLKSNIAEWEPAWHLMNWSAAALLVLYGVAFLWTVSNTKHRSWRTFLTAENIFLLAAFSAYRNWPFFALAAIPMVDHNAKQIAKELTNKPPHRINWIFAAAIVGMIAFSGWRVYQQDFSGSWQREANSPQAAVSYLQANPCPGNLFNDYDIGGYLIWKLPQAKVFIDGRMPSWEIAPGDRNYGQLPKYFDVYKKIYDNKDKQWRTAEFKAYNIRCALIGKNSDLAKALKHEKWHQVKSAGGWVLLIENSNSQSGDTQ
ncbi:hypothetical protein FWF48_00075 [Candidatus Saccharibacteria bacterium]|nr:hypothetical protein [Candidatus Saccharibacteria bacterium]